MSDNDQKFCNEFLVGGSPDCLKTADERYTMRFDDIGEPPIYWCAVCGPAAHAMGAALEAALNTRGHEFAVQAEAAISEAEREWRAKSS